MMKKPPPQQEHVEVEIDGHRYTGTYWVERDVITVYYFGGGSKSTQLGRMDGRHLAEMMLGELVKERR